MIKLDKLVSDTRQSATARDAIVFVLQNISNLVRDTDVASLGDLETAINSQVEALADAILNDRGVKPTAPVAPIQQRSQDAADLQPSMPSVREGRPVVINPPAVERSVSDPADVAKRESEKQAEANPPQPVSTPTVAQPAPPAPPSNTGLINAATNTPV